MTRADVFQELHIETSEIILGLWKQNKHLNWLANNPDKKPLAEANERMLFLCDTELVPM